MDYFYKNIIKSLISIDFSENIQQSLIKTFTRRIGGILYVIAPIMVKDYISLEVINNDIIRLENLLGDRREYLNVSKIVILELYITEYDGKQLRDFAKIDCNVENEVVVCRWIVNTKDKRRIVLGNQVSKLLNVDKFIEGILTDANYEEKMDYAIEIKETNDLKYKSLISSCKFTFSLMIINILIFIVLEINGGSRSADTLKKFGALIPDMGFSIGESYRFVTSMFLHSGISHLSSNLLSLWIFGSRVEVYFGKVRYALVYFLSGIGAGIASTLFTRSVAVGASGAIFGLESAMLIYCIFNGRKVAGLDFILLSGFIMVGLITGFVNPGVDNAGHIGGVITGICVGMFFILKDKKKIG